VGAKKSATAAPRNNNNNNDNVDRNDVFLCVYNVRQKVVFYDDFVFKNPPKKVVSPKSRHASLITSREKKT